jgi:hypothetical protein
MDTSFEWHKPGWDGDMKIGLKNIIIGIQI